MTDNFADLIRHAWVSPAGTTKSWTPEEVRIITAVSEPQPLLSELTTEANGFAPKFRIY